MLYRSSKLCCTCTNTHVFRLNYFTEAWTYIESTRDLVRDLERRHQKCKDNVAEIQKIMATWKEAPLFLRKEGKHEPLLCLDHRENNLNKRLVARRASTSRCCVSITARTTSTNG